MVTDAGGLVSLFPSPPALAVTVHSTGINWGQALATWVPIVLGMMGIIGAIVGVARWVKKWQENRTIHVEATTERLLKGFAATLNVRFQEVNDHLDAQDRHLDKQDDRFERLDRTLGTDSR